MSKVTPMNGLIGKNNFINTSGVLLKLKEAVANKIASKAVMPLEKQS
jgi:hypothetical protein